MRERHSRGHEGHTQDLGSRTCCGILVAAPWRKEMLGEEN